MWTNPTEPHDLDGKASNSMWGTSKTWETWGILQILRTRFLELVTPHMLAKRSKAPTDTLPSETRCKLCHRDYANWFHMLMACKHPDIVEYYTARHNAAGRDPALPEEGGAGQVRHTDKLWESGRRPRTADSARLDAWRGGKKENNGTTQGGQRNKA
eukprot:7196932-Pyramimonas_sp.AAC.1